MINKALFFILLFTPLNAFSQNLLEIALEDKSSIVESTPFYRELNIDTFNTFYVPRHMKSLNFKDTTLLINLIKKSNLKLDTSKWNQTEFTKKIVVKEEGEFIKVKKALSLFPNLNEEEQKALKKEIRKYNNRTSSWRSFPIAVSRPVFSENGNFSLITIRNGNNGGEIILYEKRNGNWFLVGYVKRWAY
ncbi:hypothetical protein R9C00_06420 [Flammeovirgaceae bacterium SG7u.111]|nr:hypothetical protein [Flammeovirgaceae bacterium SG7u.132]WPO37076.1 hypothetical protein R9C00_06420 [Flammeovirgaceae bacterium SG7u.111]